MSCNRLFAEKHKINNQLYGFAWRDKIGKVNYNIGMDFGLSGSKVKESSPPYVSTRPKFSSAYEPPA